MINIEVEVDQYMIEDAIVDLTPDQIHQLFMEVIERVADRDLIKKLMGSLGESYEYISRTFYND